MVRIWVSPKADWVETAFSETIEWLDSQSIIYINQTDGGMQRRIGESDDSSRSWRMQRNAELPYMHLISVFRAAPIDLLRSFHR